MTPSRWILGLGLFQNIYTNNFFFGYIILSYFFETFPGWLAGVGVAGGGWLEIPILMKTQSSVCTWTLDLDLRFVNTCENRSFQVKVSKIMLKICQTRLGYFDVTAILS